MRKYFPRPEEEQKIINRALDFDETGAFKLPGQIITGVSGVGKTWLIEEVAHQLDEREHINVGLHRILIAEPYRPLLQAARLAVDKLQQPESFIKRFRKELNKNHWMKVRKIGGALWRDFTKVAKVEKTAEAISDIVISSADAIESDKLDESLKSIPDLPEAVLIELFKGLLDLCPDERFILILDQFETAPEVVQKGFVGLIRTINQTELSNLHLVVMVNNETSEGKAFLKDYTPGLNRYCCYEYELVCLKDNLETREFINFIAEKHVPIYTSDEAFDVSGGRPLYIGTWITSSKTDDELDIEKLKKNIDNGLGKILDLQCENIDKESRMLVETLSLLPGSLNLTLDDIKVIMGYDSIDEANECLQAPVKNGILERFENKFYWFTHDLYRNRCFEILDPHLKKNYTEKKLVPFLENKIKQKEIKDWSIFEIALANVLPLTDNWEKACDLNKQLATVWAKTGAHTEALRSYQIVREIAEKHNDEKRFASALAGVGYIYSTLGEKLKALDFYNLAIPIMRKVGDHQGEAGTLNNIGQVYSALEEKQKALEFFINALTISQKIGDRVGEAVSLNNIGSVYADEEKQKALEFFNKALLLRKETGRRAGEATTLNNIGSVYFALGKKKKALDFFDKALSIVMETGDQVKVARALNNIGTVYSDLRKNQKALENLNKALKISQEIGDRANEAITLNNIGLFNDSTGEKQKALEFFHKALHIKKEIGDRSGEATTLTNIAGVHYDTGEKHKALDFFKKALSICLEISKKDTEAASRWWIARIYLDENNLIDAEAELEKSLELYKYLQSPNENEVREKLKEVRQKLGKEKDNPSI